MKKLGIILLVCIVGLYGCYASIVTTGTWRYRLTLTVNDNGTLHTGSSVIEVNVMQGLEFLPESVPAIGLRGEAVTVDLGKKGQLFALLSKENDVDYAKMFVFVMFPSELGGTTPEGIRYYSNLKGKREIPFKDLPILVRFRDINDPKTVEKVDPKNLEASFGKGITLESATIEMTHDAVTTGINKKVKWLEEWKKRGGNISGKVFFDSPPAPETILLPMNFQEK